MEDEKWTKDFVMEPQRICRKSFKIAKEIKYAFAPNDMNLTIMNKNIYI